MALWDLVQGKWSLSNGLYVDSSGNGNTLTPENSPASDIGHSGGASKAALFAQGGGTAKKDAYILDANQTGLDVTGPATFAFWIKAANFNSTYHWILNKLATAGQYAYDIYVDGTSGQKVNCRLSSNGSALTSCIGATTLSPGVWYHIAVVYDGVDIRIYINGSLDTNGANNPKTYTGGIFNGSDSFTLAAPSPQHTNGNFYFDGTIDDIAVWSRALSSVEITELYALVDDFATGGSLSGILKDQAGNTIDCSIYNCRVNMYLPNNSTGAPNRSLLVTSVDGSWSAVGLSLATKYLVTFEYEGAYAPLGLNDIAGAEFMTAV